MAQQKGYPQTYSEQVQQLCKLTTLAKDYRKADFYI